MSFFNKPKDESTEKPPLFPLGDRNDSPSLEGRKVSVPATPSIPFSKFNKIGIHSPSSQPPDEASVKSDDILLKILEPHRDLPIGSSIVLSCGFGGFAQLGLGEGEEEDNNDKNKFLTELAMPQGKGHDDMKIDDVSLKNTENVNQTDKTVLCGKRKRTDSENSSKCTMGTGTNYQNRDWVKWPAPNVLEAKIPLRMPNLDNQDIVSVEMGVMHGAAVTEDGRIFVWGGNDHCNLGFEGDDAWVPTEITKHFPKGTKIKKVSCGSSHTVFLTTEGEVFTAGTFKNDGWEGAFYDPKSKKVYKRLNKPTRLEYIGSTRSSNGDVEQKPIGKMIDVASGLDHMLMLDVAGNIWEMGVTNLGQKRSRRNWHFYLQPRRVGLKNWDIRFKAIRCGSHTNLAISTEDDLYTWGQNNYLQCGHPLRKRQSNPDLIDLPHKVNFNDPSVKFVDIGAGTHTTIALDAQGRLWSFGRNASFELGRETKVPPKQMVNGRLQQYKNEPKADLPKLVTAIDKPVVQISVGANHWFAIAEDSTTYAVGSNLEFRTGTALDEGSSRFVKVFHGGNLRQDFEIVDVSAGSNSSVFLLKRVQRRKNKPKRFLIETPVRRVKRKV